ncbi:MAG: hypothetical protein WC755_04695 [Candidatus Woesearchaeota archaeon]|jgi:hypothetical protein
MIQEIIETTKPFAFNIVNYAYNGVISHAPAFFQERPVMSAMILGSTGIYGVVKGLQYTSKKVMNKIIPKFHEEVLPILEKICITGMAATPVICSAIDPEGAKALLANHPVYTAGMAGVYAGSILGAAQDLHKRSLEKVVKEKDYLIEFFKKNDNRL